MKILKALYAVELLLAAGVEAGRAGPGVMWYQGVASLLLLAGVSGQLQPPPEHNLRRRLPPKNPCAGAPCGGLQCVPLNGNNYNCISGPSTNDCQDHTDPCHVLVVGLGWAGVMTLHELQRYKTIMQKPDFTFIGLDVDAFLGGRAQAAELVSGGGNPIMEWIFQLYSQSPQSPDYLLYENQKWNDIFFWDLSTDSEVASPVVNKAKQDWATAFECLQENGLATLLDDPLAPPALPEDKSMRDVLRDECDWPPPDGTGSLTNLERLLEWYELDWEFLPRPENTCPVRMVPIITYTGEFQDRDQFISANCHPDEDQYLAGGAPNPNWGMCTEPSNGANIVDKIARTTIQDFDTVIKTETEVTKINWCPSGSDPITVTTSRGDYYAKRVVVTSSTGMLKRQMTTTAAVAGLENGDLFNPELPNKLAALDRTFMTERESHPFTSADPPTGGGIRNDIGLYKKLYVILDEDTFAAADKPDTEFIFVARPGTDPDISCGEWQQLDFGTNAKAFFPGSRAFVCTLVTKEFEDNMKNQPQLPNANDLIEDTLFQVLDRNNGLSNIGVTAGNCMRTDKAFTLFPPVGDVYSNAVPCAYFIRDSPAPDFNVELTPPKKFWGGGWSAFTDRDPLQTKTQQQDYDCIRANLECPAAGDPLDDCLDSNNPKLLFGGESMCDRYVGFQHGAYYSGIQIANKIIKAELSDPDDWDDWRLNYATPEFCNEAPAGGGPGNYRQAKSSP